MEYTTRFGLHSQTTRLFGSVSNARTIRTIHGIITLCDVSFQRTLVRRTSRKHPYKLQFSEEILNLSSSLFTRRYWGNPG